MDKPLKIIGQNIMGKQKGCDDRLKTIMDQQNENKTKLAQLTKKDSKSFLVKDLGDIVYENKDRIAKNLFVNTHNS